MVIICVYVIFFNIRRVDKHMHMSLHVFKQSYICEYSDSYLLIFSFFVDYCSYMGVFKNRGTPKWMVYNGKPYEIGSFGGTTIFGNTHIVS